MIKITFHYRNRKQIIIIFISIIILATITSTIIYYTNDKKKIESNNTKLLVKKDTKPDKVQENKEAPNTREEQLYTVDIKGCVNSPGIYQMSPSSRIIDVIEKAGGLTENANTTVINLSKKIKDEMVIIVYSNDEVANFTKTKELEEIIQKKCNQKEENYPKNDACIDDSNETTTNLVSINNATVDELTTLPGIGSSKAQDIIDYRLMNGPFQNIEDLKNVPGIGESIFAKIKDYITL